MRTSLSSYKLIAVGGLKNSGKGEASKMLEYILNTPKPLRTYFGYNVLKKWPGKGSTTAFAKPLKQTLSIILNRPLEGFEDRTNKESVYVDLRNLELIDGCRLDEYDVLSENKFSKLIKTGEPLTRYLSIRQLMQYYGTNVIRRFLGDKTWINVTLNQCEGKNTIISDLRFKVEYDEVKQRNGIVIYIERPDCIPGSHSSEREVIQMLNDGLFDLVIENNGSLEDLFNKIKEYAI